MDKCPICGQPAYAPYRVHNDKGKIIQGCVSNFHTGHLVSPSESLFWHNRKEAKQVRKSLKKYELSTYK